MALRYYVSTEEASFFVNNKMGSSDRIPTSGTYKVGDFIISNTQANGVFGWVCTQAGTPGTWIEIGTGGSNTKTLSLSSSTVVSSPVREVAIGIKDFNKSTDFLMVYKNSTYLTEGVDYDISSDSTKIVSRTGNWNADSLGDYRFSFVVIKEVEKVNPKAVVGTENIKDNVVTMSKLGEDVKERLDGFDSQLEQIEFNFDNHKIQNLINVKDFGAKGDGVTDDTVAILNATKSAYVNDRFGIFFPRGTYIVSDTISVKNKTLVGESRIGSVIKSICSDGTKPIIKIGGISKIDSLTIQFDDNVNIPAHTKNVFIGIMTVDGSGERLLKTSSISNVNIFNVGTGISDGGVGCFSTEFRNIRIKDFSCFGVHMYGNTRTGNVWSNIYIESPNKSSLAGFLLEGEESECSINQLNLEHFIGNTAMQLKNVLSYKIGTLHIEGVEVRNTWSGYIDISNSSGVINNCTFYYTRLHKTGAHLFRLRDGYLPINKQNTIYKDNSSYLKINILNTKGLNRPDAGIYPNITGEQKTLNNSPSFTFFFRDNGYDLSSNKFIVEVDEFKWNTWNSVVSDDSEHYHNFSCDPHNMIEFVKKGQLLKIGTTEQRPTVRLCNNYSTYFDTTLNKMLFYINKSWVDSNGNRV